jgi:GDP-4-dehydro-6-deoxy-D-mannose reductase
VKRVLITGASGFVGSHLRRALPAHDAKLTCTYHRKKVIAPDENWVSINFEENAPLNELVSEVRPDQIYHLAAQTIPRYSWKLEKETITINTVGTIRLLNAVRREAPKARVLLASTNQVYGHLFEMKAKIEDADLAWPQNPYGASKALAELACLDFVNRFGLDVVIARTFNHIGANQSTDFVFSDWCHQIALAEKGKREPLLEVGNLEAEREFLHVEDVIKAYMLLMQKGVSGGIYDICTGRTQPLKKYLDFLLKKSKVPIKVNVKKSRLRAFDPLTMKGSGNRMKDLGWKPQRNVFEALEELLDDWRSKIHE